MSRRRSNLLGRCRPCQVVLTWPRSYLMLRYAHCPSCGEKLAATSWSVQDPVREWLPLTPGAALAKRNRIARAHGRKATGLGALLAEES